jgi:small-conductance mechanosensitive channel
VGVVLAGVLVALDLLDATALVGALAGTAGLAGLALGFAFKDIVENYLAGFLLALRQPFAKNDHIVVDAYDGLVVRLTPRETILMTLEGNHVRLPNATVFRSPLLNYSRNPRRRFEFDAGVGPVDDLALARTEGIEVLREMRGVMDDPSPEALLVELGESWVTVRFSGWVDQGSADFLRVRSEAIRLVKSSLEEAGISIPSPEYRVRLVRDEDQAKHPAPAVEGDVAPDLTVQRQIEEERLTSDEEDLLEAGPGPGGRGAGPPPGSEPLHPPARE